MKVFSLVHFLIQIDRFKETLDELISISGLEIVYTNDTLLIVYFIYVCLHLYVILHIIKFFYKTIVIFLDKVF